MAARVSSVTINTPDPAALSEFWSGVLGVEVQSSGGGTTRLEPDRPGGVAIAFQRVDERPTEPRSLHLDIEVDDLHAMTELVERLGGSLVKRNVLDSGFEWRVMRDPEENAFCIFVH